MTVKAIKKEQVIQKLNGGAAAFHNMGLLDADFLTDEPLTHKEALLLETPFVLLNGYLLKPLKQDDNDDEFVYVVKTLSGRTTFVLDKTSSANLNQLPYLQLPSKEMSPFDDEEMEILPSNHVTSVTLVDSIINDSMFSGDVLIMNANVTGAKIKNSQINHLRDGEDPSKRSSVTDCTIIKSSIKSSVLKGLMISNSYVVKTTASACGWGSSLKDSNVIDCVFENKNVLTLDSCSMERVEIGTTSLRARQTNFNNLRLFKNTDIILYNKFDILEIDVPQTLTGGMLMVRTSHDVFSMYSSVGELTFKINDSLEIISSKIRERYYEDYSDVITDSIVSYIAETVYSRLKVCNLITSLCLNFRLEAGVKSHHWSPVGDTFYILD